MSTRFAETSRYGSDGGVSCVAEGKAARGLQAAGTMNRAASVGVSRASLPDAAW